MHTFVVQCNEERFAARYLDVKDEEIISECVHELLMADAELLGAEWYEQHQLATQNELILALLNLANEHKASFSANFLVADALQDLENYSTSALLFKRAFNAANHAGLKFRAKGQEALSLKLLADICMCADEYQSAIDVAYDACRAFEKARNFSYSASASDAVALEYNASLLHYCVVQLFMKMNDSSDEKCEKQSFQRILNFARIHHYLSATLAQFYGVSEVSADLKNLEHSIDVLESRVNE